MAMFWKVAITGLPGRLSLELLPRKESEYSREPTNTPITWQSRTYHCVRNFDMFLERFLREKGRRTVLTDDGLVRDGLVYQLVLVVLVFQYENFRALLTRVPGFYK